MSVQALIALGVGSLALVSSLALVLRFPFERFVGLRYLVRRSRSRATTVGLSITAAITVAGALLLIASSGRSREAETVGVVLGLLGGLALLFFALLRVFSVFTTVSTMGVVLGVASLVVVLAVTSGFRREFEDKVLAVNAHLLVMSYSGLDLEERERAADRYLEKLADLPGLRRMSKFSLSSGEVMVGKVGANIKGIDVEAGAPEVERTLVEGKLDDLRKPARCAVGPAWADLDGPEDGPPVGRIILGVELARQIRAKVGDCVPVLVPFATTKDGIGTEPVSFVFKVTGLFQMGFHEYDTRLAFVNLDDARRMSEARPTLFGVELRFHDPRQALSMEQAILDRVGYEPNVIDWETLNHNLFVALEMQKVIIALFLMIIIVVAAFNIIASLTMIVLSKVREIAILAAMGARKATLTRLFLAAGSLVGFVGVGLGLGFGLAVCAVAQAYGYPLDPKVYLIAELPVDITAGELLFVGTSTQAICLLATLYPALRASRLEVVDGLRYS